MTGGFWSVPIRDHNGHGDSPKSWSGLLRSSNLLGASLDLVLGVVGVFLEKGD